jgi:hydrogenase maturation protease
MPQDTDLLILGLGNVLCADDGLGVLTVELLKRSYVAPAGVELVDGGTLGLSLLPLVMDAKRVLMIDAVRWRGRRPGSLIRLVGGQVLPAVRARLSPHQVGVADLLDSAELLGWSPVKLVLIGLVPETIELRVGLSVAIERRLHALAHRVAAEAASFGYGFSRRPKDENAAGVGRFGGGAAAVGMSRSGC